MNFGFWIGTARGFRSTRVVRRLATGSVETGGRFDGGWGGREEEFLASITIYYQLLPREKGPSDISKTQVAFGVTEDATVVGNVCEHQPEAPPQRNRRFRSRGRWEFVRLKPDRLDDFAFVRGRGEIVTDTSKR